MRRISSEIETKSVELWFEGYTREHIAKTLGIGEATVSDIIGTLPSCLQMARDIAVANRKHNLTLADARKGVEVIVQLAAVGVSPEQIPSFIQTVKKISQEAGYQPSHIIQAGMQLSNVEAESRKEYRVAIEDFKTAIKKKRELDKRNEERTKENSQLQLEIEENERLRNETLRQAKTAPQEISEVLDCKVALRQYGMDISDAATVRKVLDNIKEVGGNAKHLVSLVKEYGSVAESIAYFERQLPIERDKCSNLISQIEQYRGIVSRLHDEQEQWERIINSQKNAFNSNLYQLDQIRKNIAALERIRGALITWIGKQLGLPQEKIENLRLTSQYEMMLAAIDNALTDTLRSRYRA